MLCFFFPLVAGTDIGYSFKTSYQSTTSIRSKADFCFV